MPNNNKTEEFLQKLAPCIERGDLDTCVEEAARMAGEMVIGAEELFDLATKRWNSGNHAFAYVLALAAAHGLEGDGKAQAYYNAGVAARFLKKVENVEKLYQDAIAVNPNYAAAHYNYAALLKELNRKDEAEVQYKLAIAADPKHASAHYNYAVLLKELNRKDEAEVQYKLAIEADPKHVTAHYNYANLLSELKRNEEAEEQYKLAIAADPKDAEARNNYANLLKELEREDEAEEQYKLAIEFDPKLATAHCNYANLLKELDREDEAEEQYKLAIDFDPKLATAHYNYAILLEELDREGEAEEQYKLAIDANPKVAVAHYNYAILLKELDRKTEAEEQYKLAIDANPKVAVAHHSYAILLKELDREGEAEEQYKLAIEFDPKVAVAHYNYAILLLELDRKSEAEEQYKLAIEFNPKDAGSHSNYAILLSELNRKEEAQEQYLEAIKANPNYANAHGAYGLLLIELDRRNDAWKETEKASNIFKETGNITQSYLAKAWFYEQYSEKNFNRKKFWESGDDAGKAADEYLKAAETVDGALKDNFSQRGNILKAKSFVRKVPKKSWRRKILYWFGKNPDIPDIINNLKKAASYYEKAALCPIEERQDICNACHTSITVFSETLASMEALISKRSPEMNKKELIKKLDGARLIYKEKKMKNGVALVDTLIQLIICVDELAVHRASGLGIQKEKCGKCYNKLTEVSENLDGALNVIAEHSIEAIREYAKKQGMGFVGKETIAKFSFNKWLIGAVIAIFLGIVSNRLFSWDIDLKVLNYIKYIFFNQSAP